jgi:quinolinate synthase
MAMNDLQRLYQVLVKGDEVIEVSPALIRQARVPLDRMLAFKAGT